jgi:hypothetical protein
VVSLRVEALEARALLAYVVGATFSPTLPLTTIRENIAPSVSGPSYGATPAQIRGAYGFDSISFGGGIKGDGTGQTIAIIDAYSEPSILADLHTFDLQFGLPDPASFRVVGDNGSPTLPAPAPKGSWGIEIALDVEWAHALAPGAAILLVEAGAADGSLMSDAAWAAAQPGVSVVSMSWGSGEYDGETLNDSDFTTPAGHPGVTFLAATGDAGTPGDYPAYSPNVLAVGGTVFGGALDARGTYPGEAGWSSGGGGISLNEAQPSYQQGVVTQSTTARTIPDVSFDAATGVAVYDTYDSPATGWTAVGGTSLATPCWGALIAIANQGAAALGRGPLGGQAAMTSLYALATYLGPTTFHDITAGNNGYVAGAGYDLVTGLGTPMAPAIAEGLSGNVAAPTPLAPSGAISAEPTFRWSAVAGAQSYHLVAFDQATSAKVLDVVVGAATSYTPGAGVFAPGGTYSWSVEARAGLWSAGTSSGFAGFVMPSGGVPAPQSPGNNATITTSLPTLTWSAVDGASSYALTIVDAADPSHPIANAMPVSGTSFTFASPLPYGHTYLWAVQAFLGQPGSGSYGVASRFSSFAVTPLGTPTPLAPAAGASLTSTTPTFQWTPVAGAIGYGLVVTDLSTGATVIQAAGLTGTTYTPTTPLAKGHSYQWSVVAADAFGDVGTASAASGFSIALPPAPVPSPSPSGPSGTVATSLPSFRWSSVAGASSYGVQIIDHTGGTNQAVIPLAKVVGTSYVPSAPLIAGHTYTWQVLAYNAAGVPSGWSPALQFTVKGEPAADFDGAGRSGVSVYTPGGGFWTIVNPLSGSYRMVAFGQANSGSIPVPGDYDGVGRTELAYYTTSTATWTVLNPNTNVARSFTYGVPGGSIPVPGDYDGVGRTEPAYYTASTATWTNFNPYTATSRSVRWGTPNLFDLPIPGDYDGVGRTEIAGYIPSTSTWVIWNPLTNAQRSVTWGVPNFGSIPAPGDYDGVGRTEIAGFVPAISLWVVWNPTTNTTRQFFAGAPNLHDVPIESPIGSLAALGRLGKPSGVLTAAAHASVVVAPAPAPSATTSPVPADPAPPSRSPMPIVPSLAVSPVRSWRTVGQALAKPSWTVAS